VIEAAFLSVTLSGCVNEREIAWASCQRLRVGTKKALLQRDSNILGETDSYKAACSNRIAVTDQAHGIGSADDFVALTDQLLRVYLKWHMPYRGVSS